MSKEYKLNQLGTGIIEYSGGIPTASEIQAGIAPYYMPHGVQLCRIFFHVSNDVLVVPFITDETTAWWAKDIKFTKKGLLQEVISRFKTETNTGFIINDVYYSNNMLTKIELNDINKEYAAP